MHFFRSNNNYVMFFFYRKHTLNKIQKYKNDRMIHAESASGARSVRFFVIIKLNIKRFEKIKINEYNQLYI